MITINVIVSFTTATDATYWFKQNNNIIQMCVSFYSFRIAPYLTQHTNTRSAGSIPSFPKGQQKDKRTRRLLMRSPLQFVICLEIQKHKCDQMQCNPPTIQRGKHRAVVFVFFTQTLEPLYFFTGLLSFHLLAPQRSLPHMLVTCYCGTLLITEANRKLRASCHSQSQRQQQQQPAGITVSGCEQSGEDKGKDESLGRDNIPTMQ